MSKFLPIVIALVLFSVSSATFLRPWDNQTWVSKNPNIDFYGIKYWWNLPAFHETLDSLDTGRAGAINMPSGVHADIKNTAEAVAEAADRKDTCIIYMTASVGAFFWAPTALFLTPFSENAGCVSYKDSWKTAVSSALSAAEKALSESGRSIQEARAAYEEMVFMGLCEEDYRWAGSDRCPELRSAFIAVESNITEGKYGKYALLLGYEQELKANLHDPVPDMSAWASMLELAFGDSGVVETFEEVKAAAHSAKSDSETAYQGFMEDALIKKAEAEKRINQLQDQHLFLIDQSVSGYEVKDTGSIEERFRDILDMKDSTDMTFAQAKAVKSRTGEKGYFSTAVALMSQADGSYSEVLESTDYLKTDAEEAVRQKKEEAEEEIRDTEKSFSSVPGSTEAMNLLEDARASLGKGDGAATLGARFTFYSQAAALARSARDAGSMAAEAQAWSALSLLEDLVIRAEKDGIEVIGEKEILTLASWLSPAQAQGAAQDAIGAIILKAQARYEADILSSRARIYDKLSLAGPDGADLYTDIENLESGLVADDGMLYPEAIGSLSKLLKGYQKIEEELDNHMSAIVGNAMSAEIMPSIGHVVLDEPSEIMIDAVLANPRPYGAKDVPVKLRTGSFGFLFSDIAYGKEGVSSVRESGDGLVLVLPEVQPFENRRIIFEKETIIARTSKSMVNADGLGLGKAIVRKQVEFELEFDISSLTISEDCEDALIDGMGPARPLEAGKHILSCEYIEEDAYGETSANFRSYPIAATSRVEFDIHITPDMDLDSVPVIIDSPEDSAISKFKVVSVTGGHIREQNRLSDTQYSATIADLKKGNTAVIRVSYTIDDTPTFVQSQLFALQLANLSPTASDLVDQAVFQAEAANYSKALELISQASALLKADEKADAKLKDKKEELVGKIQAELSDIESALETTISDSTLASRLATRRDELKLLLEDAASQSLEESVEALGQADLKWLGKEINSFRKESYKSYNDLKERFYLAGNTTTPEEFLLFEDAFQKLEAGGRISYALEAAEALAAAERTVLLQEQSKSSEDARLASLLESLESETLAVYEHYSREASAAKGTDYSSFFTITESKIERTVKDTESALKKDASLAVSKMEELAQIKDKMELTLESLEKESDAKISVLSSLVESADDAKKAELRTKLDGIRRLASTGEYVNALRAGSSLSKEMENGSGPSQDGLLILGFTALAMLAAAGFYMFKQQKPKELKKLPSLSDASVGAARVKTEKEKVTSSIPSPLSAPPSRSQTPRKQGSGNSPALR